MVITLSLPYEKKIQYRRISDTKETISLLIQLIEDVYIPCIKENWQSEEVALLVDKIYLIKNNATKMETDLKFLMDIITKVYGSD